MGQVPADAVTVINSVADVTELRLPSGARVAYATQTTYSVDDASTIIAALRQRFPDIAEPPRSDICYATTNRQAAVKRMAQNVDAIIVAGEEFSSNASRLAEVARSAGCPSVQLVAAPQEVDWRALEASLSIGITAAASTPEASVSAILDSLAERFDLDVTEMPEFHENAVFKPVALS